MPSKSVDDGAWMSVYSNLLGTCPHSDTALIAVEVIVDLRREHTTRFEG